MKNFTMYMLRSSLGTMAILVTFLGFGVIAVILEALTWEALGEWTVKALLVAAVVVVVSAVMGLLGSFAKSNK